MTPIAIQINPLQGLSKARLILGTLTLFVVGALIVYCAVHFQFGEGGAFCAGFAATFIFGPVLEWYLHVFYTHYDLRFQTRVYERHHRSHHRLGGQATTHPVWYRMGEQFIGQILAGCLFIALPLVLLTHNLAIGVGSAFATTFVSFSIAFLHHCYHGEVKMFPFKNSRWFKQLQRQHLTHHNDLSVNLNVSIPLADVVFGTLK